MYGIERIFLIKSALSAMDTANDRKFKKFEDKLIGFGISLSWKQCIAPFGTKNVMSSYMDKDIEIIKSGSVEKMFFVP